MNSKPLWIALAGSGLIEVHLPRAWGPAKSAPSLTAPEQDFARGYTATTGRTPSKAIEFMRLEEARRLLEDTDKSIDEISDQIGFGNTERMRTTFQRNLKVSPRDYRLRFGCAT